MLTKKGDEFLISDCSKILDIRDFLRENRNNPDISHKAIDELYSLYIYLHNLCDSEYFSLPFLAQKPDPPDFVLNQQVKGHKTGIEVVTSATQSEKSAWGIIKKKQEECPHKEFLIEIPEYVPDANIDLKDKNEREKGIRELKEPLISDGFGDYGKEKAWMKCISQRLNEKICKLNKKYFQKYQRNELIIYDDTEYFPNMDYIISHPSNFQQEYKSSPKVNFDSVHIIMNVVHLFIADVFGQFIRLNIPLDLV
jgi:hypothetical protein